MAARPPKAKPKGWCHRPAKAPPSGELTRASATSEARSRSRPVDEALFAQRPDVGRPADEVQRRRLDAVAEGAEHRLRQARLVPRPLVAAAVNEEGRGEQRAAPLGARPVLADAHRRGSERRRLRLRRRKPELLGDLLERAFGEFRPALHQRIVDWPEVAGRGEGELGELGRAVGHRVVAPRPLAEDVAQALAEAVAEIGDDRMGGVAIGTGVAAVFDEGDRRLGRPEDVVAAGIDRAVEAGRQGVGHRRHPRLRAPSL